MKILSWNINGIRASKIDLKKLFDSLDADIICLQETKVTRDQLDEPTAIVDGYNSYFSFSKKRSGYSGVANFCKDSAIPVKAEEGLSNLLNPGDSSDEKIGCYGDLSEFTEDELEALDAEGRTVITQHKFRKKNGEEATLTVINVYCPRVDPEREDRHMYKMRFLSLLQIRAEALVRNGSHVIVLGDLNLSHKKLDNCEFDSETFATKPSRMWMNQFLWPQGRDPEIMDVENKEDFPGTTSSSEGGMFVDTFRHLYPQQPEAYTNWCSLTSARQTNFGRRLDYIVSDITMATDQLVDSVVMIDVDGSDHCPVKSEFTGTFTSASKCPQLCTKFLPEFAGKQQKLLSFFTKKAKSEDIQENSIKTNTQSNSKHSVCSTGDQQKNLKKRASCESVSEVMPAKKRKEENSTKKAAGLSKQSSLINFFGKQTSKMEQSKKMAETVINTKIEDVSKVENSNKSSEDSPISSQESNSSDDKTTTKSSATAWKNLLKGPPTAPLCKGHKEPCVLRTVKKEGPNKGKQFFVCCRGEGLSTNPEARCDYFKWVERKK